MSIKMDLKCTKCKAGWKVEGMPEQFYKNALNEFFDNHRQCSKVAAKTAEPDAQPITNKGVQNAEARTRQAARYIT